MNACFTVSRVTALLSFMQLVCVAEISQAQQWSEVPVPAPSDLDAGSLFGWCVAMDEDLLVVGAPGADDPGPNSGAVYVFSRNAGGLGQWEEVQRLQVADLASGARFGSWLEWRDGLLLVGAPNDAVNGVVAGSIYTFRRNTDGQFVQEQRLVPIVRGINMRFGEHFVSARTADVPHLLVSAAPGADYQPGILNTFNCLGSVLLFSADAGNGFDALDDYSPPTGLTVGAGFAQRVALVNDGSNAATVIAVSGRLMSTAIARVSAPDGIDGGEWPRDDTLTAPDVWGSAIVSAGSELVARSGSLFATARTDEHNVVLCYALSSGALVQDGVLLPDTDLIDLSNRFGHAIAPDANDAFLTHGLVAVGAPGADIGMPVGSCMLYQRDIGSEGNWTSTARLIPSDAEMGALFGASVGVSWPYVAVGAPGHGPDDRGKVYVFEDPTNTVMERSVNSVDVRIYPVPVRDLLRVDLASTAPLEAAFRVVDLSGKEVRSGGVNATTFSIDVTGLVLGSYVLQITTGGASSHERFVIAP
ncbi:MAG TPA: T9SS type A sorting domain-containing protein [Flavobacteriales bacterium]|nr:T9SS type A sorting domain-containing protein [Flavobacteriales bacterium]